MTDKRLLAIGKNFRRGIVDKNSSNRYCYMVCAPLAGYLHYLDMVVEVVEGEVGDNQHFWIRLPDGRVLDPTADQFNDQVSSPLPPVYLGPPHEIHQPLLKEDARMTAHNRRT
jgi:hypothetical protein